MSFIDAHGFPADLVLRVLAGPESTYDDWRARRMTLSRRELDDAALLEQIIKVAPRVNSRPPTALRRCGWSCAARACGSGASGGGRGPRQW